MSEFVEKARRATAGGIGIGLAGTMALLLARAGVSRGYFPAGTADAVLVVVLACLAAVLVWFTFTAELTSGGDGA